MSPAQTPIAAGIYGFETTVVERPELMAPAVRNAGVYRTGSLWPRGQDDLALVGNVVTSPMFTEEYFA